MKGDLLSREYAKVQGERECDIVLQKFSKTIETNSRRGIVSHTTNK